MMKQHDEKQAREGRVYLNYTSTALFITKGSHDKLKQGKILEAEADIEAMDIMALLSLDFPFTKTAFL